MREWVFVSNPDHFRMQEALVPGEVLDWPTFGKFKFAVGDEVYFYSSTPIAQMVGKLEIEETGLAFDQVDPRNELRKWPRRFSSIPWMRMRVLQAAPVPFKPLQSRSLYYHTGFKPSPYPKLLHNNEREYVHRAFDEAMTYTVDSIRRDGPLNQHALARVERGEILRAAVDRMDGGRIAWVNYEDSTVRVRLCSKDGEASCEIECMGVVRAMWDYDSHNSVISGIRLDVEDTYLLLTVESASLEILAASIRIN